MENRRKLEPYEATSEAPFPHREYFRSFARCGVFAECRKNVAHIGSGYARRLFDVKAAKESLTPFPPRCLVGFDFLYFSFFFFIFIFIVSALILLLAYGDRGLWALCQRLTGSIHPRLPCRLCGVLFARRMILYKIILRENMRYFYVWNWK